MLQIPPQKLKEFLTKEGLIAGDYFDKLLTEAERMGQNIGDLLISKEVISVDYFYKFLADYFKVERADFAARPIDENILQRLSLDIFLMGLIFPISRLVPITTKLL